MRARHEATSARDVSVTAARGVRVVVVLGYSDGPRGELHPVCAARLAHAAELTTADDVVVLSGWARAPHAQSEAELMHASWRGQAREVVVDPDARTTVENLANALNDVLRVGALEVVIVTSAWHEARANAALARPPHGREGALHVAARRVPLGIAPRADAVAAPALPALVGGPEELADLMSCLRIGTAGTRSSPPPRPGRRSAAA
jgi:DUF218 domain